MPAGPTEDVEVLGDAVGLGRLGDDGAALLQVPAQHHLRRGLAVRLRDATDDRVLQRAAVAAVAVEGDAADRGLRLGQDAVLGAEGLDLALLEEGVDLDLVDRRHDGGGLEERLQVLDREVADADRPDLPLLQQGLERLPAKPALMVAVTPMAAPLGIERRSARAQGEKLHGVATVGERQLARAADTAAATAQA
jgi:hypothetical protein